MEIFKLLILFSIIFPSFSYAQKSSQAPLEIKSLDGSVDNWPWQLKVSNGQITDNGDGTETLTVGAAYWTLSGSNLYPSSTSYTTTVGSSNTSLDILTVQTGATGGATINSTAAITGYDTNAELLLGLNNNVTDSSQNALTVSNTGVTFANTTPPFTGIYYAVMAAGTDFLTVPNESYFNFAGNNFTFETEFYLASQLTNGQDVILFSQWAANNHSVECYYYNKSNTLTIETVYSTDGTTNKAVFDENTTISAAAWHHFAFVRNGTNFMIFIDGTQVGSSYNVGTDVLYSGTSTIQLGGDHAINMQGYRISNNARYTTTFTPPASPLGLSSGTPAVTFAVNGTGQAAIQKNSYNNTLSIINNGITGQTIDASGNTTFPKSILATSTTGVGWTAKTGANTACNTTCGTSACAFGFDNGLAALVSCSDATADSCVCMGS